MIVYSGAGHTDVVVAAFSGEDVVTVDSIDELRDALDGEGELLFVVDPASVDEDAVDDVRERVDRVVPTVVLTDEPGETDLAFDACADADPSVDDLRAAADRARRVAAYRESVSDLYDRSQQHTADGLSPELVETRREADRRFESLPPLDSTTIDALLRERDDE